MAPVVRRHLRARIALAACFAVALLLTPAAQTRAPGRLVAIGDVHGAYPQFVALLQHIGLIDAKLNWIGGSTVLVQTGDVIDRGTESRASLDLLMSLERQAPRKGGQVIPLLGNHEVLNLIGQLAFVTPDIYTTFADSGSNARRQQAYADYLAILGAHDGHGHSLAPPTSDEARTSWMEAHPLGFVEHRDAFGPKGTYGRWLRRRHAVVQIGDGVFVHGGLSPTLRMSSVKELDDRMRAELPVFDTIWQGLVDARIIWRYMTLVEAARFVTEETAWLAKSGRPVPPATDTAMKRLVDVDSWMAGLRPNGPLWYRGLAEPPDEALSTGLTDMLARLRARYLVVGHTPQANREIGTNLGGRVFLIDTGMLPSVYNGRATALEIRNGHFAALSTDRPPAELPSPSASN